MIRIPVRLATCIGLCMLGWLGAILGDGSWQWMSMIFVLWGAAACIMIPPKLPVWSSKRRSRVRISEIKQDYFTTFWLYVERYVKYIRIFRLMYANYLRRYGGGLPYDYDTHTKRATHLACTCTISVISIYYLDMLGIILSLSPLVVLYPLVQVNSMVKRRKVQVEEEMSFFMAYLTTMLGVGYGLYRALESVRDAPDVFVALSRDAAMVTQKVVMGTHHIEALRQYAEGHPVQAFKDFLHGYISKHETVGPVPSYAETKAEQFFEMYRQTWVRYKETAIMLCTMAVMASVIIPIMLVMMVFIATPATTGIILNLGPLLGPMLCIMMLFLVVNSQPGTGVRIKPWLPSIGIGAGTVVGVHLFWTVILVPGAGIWDTDPGITISLGFLAGGLANYIMVRGQLEGASNIDRHLPEFLEDVYEQTLAGSDMTTILRQQAFGGSYTGRFGRLLNGIVSKLDVGNTMTESCREARQHSRYLSFTLLILTRLQEIGGTKNTPAVLQQMTKFMSNILVTKLDVTKSLRMGAMMIYISPLMLVGITHAMLSLFMDAGPATESLSMILPPGAMESFGPPSPDSHYKERLGLVAALLTCPMGVVAAKITRFTALDTTPLVIVAAVNIASIVMIPMVVEAFI